jgi:hypothetical protein
MTSVGARMGFGGEEREYAVKEMMALLVEDRMGGGSTDAPWGDAPRS